MTTIAILITILNIPRVIILIGKNIRFAIGRRIVLITPSKEPTKNKVFICWPVVSSGANPTPSIKKIPIVKANIPTITFLKNFLTIKRDKNFGSAEF